MYLLYSFCVLHLESEIICFVYVRAVFVQTCPGSGIGVCMLPSCIPVFVLFSCFFSGSLFLCTAAATALSLCCTRVLIAVSASVARFLSDLVVA